MSAFEGIRRVLRLGVARRELEEELAFHHQCAVEELMARGRSREEAEAEARRRFGDERRWRREIERVDRTAETRLRWVERGAAVLWSLRLALRRMRRSPGFTAAVVLTFALGIGANAAMFGIVDRLLLSPPAHVTGAEAIRRLGVNRFVPFAGKRQTMDVVSYPDVAALSAARSFRVAARAGQEMTLGRGAGARQVKAELVSGRYFGVLGARPALGRFLGPQDEREEARVAVLGYGFWQREYGGDPGVLGRTVDFGSGPFTVVGVAPRGFTGMDLGAVDLWLPLHSAAPLVRSPSWAENRNWYWLTPVARLAPGVSSARAAAEATALLRAQRAGGAEGPEAGEHDATARVEASPLIAARGPEPSGEARVATWLAGISFFVLLIACANVANLLLARALRQQREVGIRLALGSSRARVLGQVLVETLLLAALGGVAALAVGHYGAILIGRLLLPGVDWSATTLDLRAVGLVALLTLLAGAVSGLVPALQMARPRVAEVLKSGARTISGRMSRTRAGLTVLQAALSAVLLVGAGLFVLSLHRVHGIDLGYDPDGALFVSPVFDRDLTDARTREFYRDAAERLRRTPGVEAVSPDLSVPFWTMESHGVHLPGADSGLVNTTGSPGFHVVDAEYFRVMRSEVVRGRLLAPSDRRGAQRVAVVSEGLARTAWPREDALGECLIVGDTAKGAPAVCTTVVGVVENARRFSLTDEGPTMDLYLAAAQEPLDALPSGLLVRVRDRDRDAPARVRRALLSMGGGLRYVEVRPLRELSDPQARSWSMGAAMFSLFGLIALVVAGLGLYSVLAFAVAQRTLELGIRSALGAPRGRLLGMVLVQAARLTAVGLVIGLVAAVLLAPRMEPLLYETSPRDPAVLLAVAATLVAIGLLAGLVPARRATRVDPSVALRAE